ncbi:unnamed protein product [Rhizoctonia solani]|uniref:Uncharacterized protein n=1 Tax=Rhizoctonia solani TaxID=456999 RepID=A0A8H3BKX5_9AGAM|nr:unnamed protein product [Rhizoctonia solani]
MKDLHDYAPPIIALSYGLLSIVFILKVILEWRLEIHIPLLAERICFTLAYCSQIVTLYTIFPAVPYIWDTARFVVLPKRLRERDTPCDSEEPLLPEYSAHPTEVIEIQELAGQENQMLVQKDGYTILPKEDPDLERGDVNNAK